MQEVNIYCHLKHAKQLQSTQDKKKSNFYYSLLYIDYCSNITKLAEPIAAISAIAHSARMCRRYKSMPFWKYVNLTDFSAELCLSRQSHECLPL